MVLKRWELVCALAGIALVAGGFTARQSLDAGVSDHVLVAGDCAMPMSVIQAKEPVGSAVVFHGLNASRQLMFPSGRQIAALGFDAYLLDAPGHGDSKDRFSFARAEQCALAAVDALAARPTISRGRIILLGHSMGGDIAIRAAAQRSVAATIAISPGPLYPVPYTPDHLRPYGPPPRYPDNLLVLAGGLDLPGFSDGGKQIVERAREHASLAVFAEVPFATHTGILTRADTWRRIRGHLSRSAPVREADARLWLQFLTLALPAGVALLFPATVALVCSLPRYDVGGWIVWLRPFPVIAAVWLAVAMFVVAVVGFNPSQLPHLYTGTYLKNVLLWSGSLLLTWLLHAELLRRPAAWGHVAPIGAQPPAETLDDDSNAEGSAEPSTVHRRDRNTLSWLERSAPFLIGASLGLATVVALGYAVLGWADMWLSPERWWRFAYLAAMLFNYFLAEEIVLEQWPVPRRAPLLRCFVLRAILWAPMVAALWLLESPHVLVLVMAPAFAVLTVVQRLAANLIRSRTRTVAAPAIFSAILAAWLIAALFPLQ